MNMKSRRMCHAHNLLGDVLCHTDEWQIGTRCDTVHHSQFAASIGNAFHFVLGTLDFDCLQAMLWSTTGQQSRQ